MNFDNDYFHGLSGAVDTWDVRRTVEVSLDHLEKILKTGGLYSKKKLLELGYESNGKPVYNGDEYISLCDKNLTKEEQKEVNDEMSSVYDNYVENKIAIVIDKSINETCEFRHGEYEKLPGERQVKDYIDISNFKAIIVGLEHEVLRDTVAEMIDSMLKKYNIEIPIVDNKYNTLILNEKEKNK